MRRTAYGLAVASIAALASTSVAVAGEEITYSADSTTLKGYISRPAEAGGKRPAVLVVHEWWGNNDYTRKRADMLAGLGYVALAVDMYGNGKTVDNPKEAGALSGEASKNLDVSEKRFAAARALLARQPDVDARRIAAIGYCFGGGIVLQMARRGVDLAGVVSFHGSLGTQTLAKAGAVKAKVLVRRRGMDVPQVSNRTALVIGASAAIGHAVPKEYGSRSTRAARDRLKEVARESGGRTLDGGVECDGEAHHNCCRRHGLRTDV